MKTSCIRLRYQMISIFEDCLGIFERTKNHVYDLEKGDTMKLTLCRESDDSYYFIVGYHHICLDGTGWDALASEIQEAYQSGRLSPVPRQYSEWAYNQRMTVESGSAGLDREFWKTELSPQPPILPLFPMSKASQRSPMHRYEQHFLDIKLDATLSELIRERCRSHKVSPFHFHLAVFKILLFRLLDVDDLCIGFSDSNRVEAGDDRVIGCLLNLLPLRFSLNKTQIFYNAIKEARSKAFAALEHSKVPFNVILDDIGISRSTMNTPVFQAFIDYRQHGRKTFAGHDVYQPPESLSRGDTAYDIILSVSEVQNGDCTVSIGCQSTLYSENDTRIVARCYSVLLEAFAKRPAARVASIQLFAATDTEDALAVGRGK
jgi:hybrid polyketide synthase / nonribosomal peptide synthetase ACE1